MTPTAAADARRTAWPAGSRSWPWPLPALVAWAAGWALWLAARQAGAGERWALLAGLALATTLALAWPHRGRWRRAIAAAGFPLSAWAAGASLTVPAWVWLLPLLALALLYPLRAWRDAPFFPTPGGALRGLDAVVRQAPARVLDAGCGIGHGLAELQRLWPQAHLHGVEWSRPLAGLARWRVPQAQVRRGDMWAGSWADFDLVYLFQRPESMARAWQRAQAEMPHGGWLVSLEFECPEVKPAAVLRDGRARPVWVYRIGTGTGPQAGTGTGRGTRSIAAVTGR